MALFPRIVLHAPPWDSKALEVFVEDCIRDRVVLVGVVGPDCCRVEDVIDELVVGDGSDDDRFFVTAADPNWSLAEARRFVASWSIDGDGGGPVQEIRLPS